MILSSHMMMSEVGGKKGKLLMKKCWEELRVCSFPIFTKMLSHNNNKKKIAAKPFGRPPSTKCILPLSAFAGSASALLFYVPRIQS